MKISRKSRIRVSVLVSIEGYGRIRSSQNPSTRIWCNPEFRSQALRFAEALLVTEYGYSDADRSDFSHPTEQAIEVLSLNLPAD